MDDCGTKSAEFLNECFSYNGRELVWNKRPESHFASARAMNIWNAKYPGKVAGRGVASKSVRHIQIKINGKMFFAHRIILAMSGISIPEEVDHINGIKTDNRIENLRLATRSENMMNRNGWSKKGFRKGVNMDGKKFIAYIYLGGLRLNLGRFDNESDAIAARELAEINIHKQFRHMGIEP